MKLALEKNLQVQLYRERVRFAHAVVYGSYSPYDPVFGIDGRYASTTDEGTQTGSTVVLPGERSGYALQTGITGWAPTGLRYDIGGDLFYNRRDGFSGNTNGPPLPFSLVDYRLDTGILLQQPLLRNLWIDQYRYAIKFNKQALLGREHELMFRISEVIRDVQLNYFELIYAHENVRVREKALELAQRQAAENRKRVEVGTMAPLDEKQAEAAAATARADLIRALQELGTQENLLINLITDNYEEWVGTRITPTENMVAVPQSYNLTASWVSALTHRGDFNQRRAEVEQTGIELQYRRNQLFPQLDLVGTYGRQGIDRRFSPALAEIRDEGLPRYSFGFVFSIPLENRGPRSLYRQAQSSQKEFQIGLQALRQQILIEVEDAIGNAQGAFQTVGATREARLAAEAAYEAEVKKLENGKSTSFNVLSLQNDFTTARSAEIRALADYNRALTEIAFREGTILEKRRIRVEP